jgi:signal transduction histidine kinase
MAAGAEILAEIAASAQAGRVLKGNELPALGVPSDKALAGPQLSLAESLQAAAIFFDITVDSMSGHASSDPALFPSFVTCIAALNESLYRRLGRVSAAYTRQLVEHIHRAQLDERQRIARELHDRLGEELSIALRQLELREISGPPRTTVTEQQNSPVKGAIVEAMNRLRSITSDLRAEPVTSLEKALTRYVDAMMADADMRLRVSGDENWATPGVIDQVFLVLREALRNAFTHGAPQLVKVAVDFSPEALRASVHDDGCGFVLRDVDRGQAGTAGLVSMRERMALIGGTLTISSAPAQGTYIELHVPLSGHCADRSP